MSRILDRLDVIASAVPGLEGRLNREAVAVVGHSMGGHTASLLLGARLTDPDDGSEVDLAEPRVKAGVVMSGPGRGGDALSEYAAENYKFFDKPDFSHMTTPTLVVAGAEDDVPYLSVTGPAWFRDPYVLAPGPKSLLTVFDGEHGLGGIAGYDLAETTDENPARVAMVQRLTTAYLRSQLDESDAWQDALDELAAEDAPLGRVESK